MLKQIHINNLANKIKNALNHNLIQCIKNMSFEILLNHYCYVKINKYELITIDTFQYFLFDIIYPKCIINLLQLNNNFDIMNRLVIHYFGFNNVRLIYYLTNFNNDIIISFYLKIIDDDLHFLLVS